MHIGAKTSRKVGEDIDRAPLLLSLLLLLPWALERAKWDKILEEFNDPDAKGRLRACQDNGQFMIQCVVLHRVYHKFQDNECSQMHRRL